jgi:hypothetical protein
VRPLPYLQSQKVRSRIEHVMFIEVCAVYHWPAASHPCCITITSRLCLWQTIRRLFVGHLFSVSVGVTKYLCEQRERLTERSESESEAGETVLALPEN